MARRKKYLTGRVYYTNDKILVGGKGKPRRVVAMGNDRENMEVRRISRLYDDNGKRRAYLTPIEKYPDVRIPSGVEDKTFRKTVNGKPLQEKYMKKSKTRLNKWDMDKIRWGKRKNK